MGNLQATSNGSVRLVARPYEEAIQNIIESIPTHTYVSYGRLRESIPCGKVSNWLTYRLPSVSTIEATHLENVYHSPSTNNGVLSEGERARMARCCFSSATEFAILKNENVETTHCWESHLTNGQLEESSLLGGISILPKLKPSRQKKISSQVSAPPPPPSMLCDEYGDLHSALATRHCLQERIELEEIPVTTTTTSSSSTEHITPRLLEGKQLNNNHDNHVSYPIQDPLPSVIYSPYTNNLTHGHTSIPVYGVITNHKPFLEPEILDYFLPFILDNSLSSCLSVCPHWFITIYTYLQQRVTPILEAFKATYSGHFLDFETSTFSIQPLFTAINSVVRIDLLIYCKVLPSCAHQCIQFGYSFSYLPSMNITEIHNDKETDNSSIIYSKDLLVDQPSKIDPLMSSRLAPDPSPSCINDNMSGIILRPKINYSLNKHIYQSQFRFEALKCNSKRTIWAHRDLCRFHGDELMVASLANVPTVNINDYLEIPINISNAFGLIDLNSITWLKAETVPFLYKSFGQLCEIERPNQQWVGLDAFQPTTNERLQVNDYFGPQWKHIKTEFTGIDITCSRSVYIASQTGEVPQSRRWLGIESIVKPTGSVIVCPLTRLGLQHDRFSRQQVRQGDTIVLYISQGGGILQ